MSNENAVRRELNTIKILLVLVLFAGFAWWLIDREDSAVREGRPQDCWTSQCSTDAVQTIARRMRGF